MKVSLERRLRKIELVNNVIDPDAPMPAGVYRNFVESLHIIYGDPNEPMPEIGRIPTNREFEASLQKVIDRVYGEIRN